jgi:hypothetical protein
MASPPPRLPPLDGTLGNIQIALVVATWLFGIETLQAFNYYRDFGEAGNLIRPSVFSFLIACSKGSENLEGVGVFALERNWLPCLTARR